MKRLLKRMGLFLFVFLLVLVFLDYLSMKEPWRTKIAYLTNSYEFITGNVGTDQIIPYINKVQEQDQSTILIIGDSVCAQMFSGLQEYNENVCIAGTNAAITVAGQYILAKEYVANHPDVTDIYLIMRPDSLCRSFDTEWGYQYVVMPFVRTNTIYLLEKDTIEVLEKVYGKVFMNPYVVKAIDKSAVNRKLYLNMLAEHSDGYMQTYQFELAERYIGEIYKLCIENNVNLHLMASPVSERSVGEVEELRKEYECTELYSYFPDFFDEIYYYPAEQAADGVHFSGEYAKQEAYNQKIEAMIKGTELEGILKFE